MAVSLPEESDEYPLFEEGLTRRLIPINSFRLGRQPLPDVADYLLFSSAVTPVQPADVHLGEDWYLRTLRAGR